MTFTFWFEQQKSGGDGISASEKRGRCRRVKCSNCPVDNRVKGFHLCNLKKDPEKDGKVITIYLGI